MGRRHNTRDWQANTSSPIIRLLLYVIIMAYVVVDYYMRLSDQCDTTGFDAPSLLWQVEKGILRDNLSIYKPAQIFKLKGTAFENPQTYS